MGGDGSGRLWEQKYASQDSTDGALFKSWQVAAELSHQQAKPLGYAEKHANFVAAAPQLSFIAAVMVAAEPCGLKQLPAPPKPHVNGKAPSKLATGAQKPSEYHPHAYPPDWLLYCCTQSPHVALLEQDAVVKPDAGQGVR